MSSDAAVLADTLTRAYLIPMGWKLAGAAVVLVVGWWVAGLVRAALARTLRLRKFDPTLARYFETGASVGLRLLVVIVVLSVLGVETTSFAALIAAAGIAIGAAWAGLLSNFAAGVFLLLFRPFKVGDYIDGAGGAAGTVVDLSLFTTELATPDNVQVIVPNSLLWGATLRNYSFHKTRRVDFLLGIGYRDSIETAVGAINEVIAAEPRIHAKPPPQVAVGPHEPQLPPQPSSPHSLPVQLGVQGAPQTLTKPEPPQVAGGVHSPQLPPQPSPPHCLPVQSGVQPPLCCARASRLRLTGVNSAPANTPSRARRSRILAARRASASNRRLSIGCSSGAWVRWKAVSTMEVDGWG